MNSSKLGKTLKECRILKGVTLREVEDLTGISNAYLSQLENGKIKKPSADILYKLSVFYNINVEVFLIVSGIIKQIEPNSGNSILLNLKLTPDEEQQLTKYLKFLRSNQ